MHLHTLDHRKLSTWNIAQVHNMYKCTYIKRGRGWGVGHYLVIGGWYHFVHFAVLHGMPHFYTQENGVCGADGDDPPTGSNLPHWVDQLAPHVG